MLDTAMYLLGQKLTRIGPLRPLEVCQFPYFPVCNEAGWQDTYRRLENELPNSLMDNSPLGVALLFGESHFISLLPLLAGKGIGLAVLADIQPKMERARSVLIKCFESSETIEEFLKNFKENKLQPSGDTDFILDLYADNANVKLKEGFHFLSSDARYRECKEAMRSVVISHIHYNVFNAKLSGVIADAIHEAGAKISLVNVNNINNYDTSYWMRASLRSLLNHSPAAIILHSTSEPLSAVWDSMVALNLLAFEKVMDERRTLDIFEVKYNLRTVLTIARQSLPGGVFDRMPFLAKKHFVILHLKDAIDAYHNHSHHDGLNFDPLIVKSAEEVLSQHLDAMKPNSTTRPLQFQSKPAVANLQNPLFPHLYL